MAIYSKNLSYSPPFDGYELDGTSGSWNEESSDEEPTPSYNQTLLSVFKENFRSNFDGDFSDRENDFIQIFESVGSGNFGNVFQFLDKERGLLKVVKVIYLQPSLKRCGEHLALGLYHPYLQRIEAVIIKKNGFFQWIEGHQFVEENDRPIGVISPFYEGRDLSHLVDSNLQLSPHLVIKMAKQVSSALIYLHRNGFIHRDVKQSNIIMSKNGTFTLIDLGLLTRKKDGEKIAYDGISAINYTPAETYDIFDERVDAFAFGITLTELLVGRTLLQYTTKDFKDAIIKITKEHPNSSIIDLKLNDQEIVRVMTHSILLFHALKDLTMLREVMRSTVDDVNKNQFIYTNHK